MAGVPFVYIVFGINEVLKNYDYVTPEKLQRFIGEDDTFRIKPLLSHCKLALRLMEDSGFIKKEGKVYYKSCE